VAVFLHQSDNDTLHSVGGSKMGLRRLKNVFDPDSSYILAPDCDWSQGETFIYDGTNGECVVPPSAHKERPLWYSLEEGTCNVLQVNSTHLEFDVHRTETGILFSSVPHKYVLDPEESDKFSDLSLFKDKAVSILIKGGDIGEILFVGVLDMTAEGNGLITGKKIHGDLDLSHDTSTTYSFVLGSVDRVRAWSAVGLGMCSSDGQGNVSIEVDDFVSFKDDRIDPGFPMKFFENVNAAIFSENLGYEVFTIDKVDTDYWTPESPHTGSIEGSTYFSTRIGAWDTQLGPSSSVQERCFIFVDAEDVPTFDDVKRVAKKHCSADAECSYVGKDCLPKFCECSTWSSNCMDGTHCIDQRSIINDCADGGDLDGIVDFVTLGLVANRQCFEYNENAIAFGVAAVIVIAAVGIIFVGAFAVGAGGAAAATGAGTEAAALASGTEAIVGESLSQAGLQALVADELSLTMAQFFELAAQDGALTAEQFFALVESS